MADTEHDGPERPRDVPKPPQPPQPPRGGGAPKAEPAAKGTPTPAPTGTPVTQQLGRVVLIVAAVLFGVFAVFNFQYVDFSWVFGRTEVVRQGTNGQRLSGGVPLIILLVMSFSLGALVAWIGTVRSERRRRKRAE